MLNLILDHVSIVPEPCILYSVLSLNLLHYKLSVSLSSYKFDSSFLCSSNTQQQGFILSCVVGVFELQLVGKLSHISTWGYEHHTSYVPGSSTTAIQL